MSMTSTHNIISSLHSYSQFYQTAHNMIKNQLILPHRRSLDNEILHKLTQIQINQYNWIEIEIFDLSKDIKSKFTKLTQQEIAVVLIKIKNILEEMQKFCSSLKILFVFQLFQKITICLTIMASLNFQNQNTESFVQTYSNNKSDIIKKQKLLQSKYQIHANKKQNSQLLQNEKIKKKTRRKYYSKDMKKLMMGGISLYNESYKRQIQNRQLLIGYMDTINDNSKDKREFWEELERQFKQTIGIAENSETAQNCKSKQESHKEFKEFSVTLHNKIQQNKKVNFEEGVKIMSGETHSANDNNAIYNSKIFDYELEVKNQSFIDLEKTIEGVAEVYQNQKMFTLDSIKKLLRQMSSFYQKLIKDLNAKITQKQSDIQQLEYKLYVRSMNVKQVATQSMPCRLTETLTKQYQRLKQNETKNKTLVESLQDVISRQNIQIMNYERLNLENQRRLQLQQKKAAQLEIRIKQQQKSRKILKHRTIKHIGFAQNIQFPESASEIKEHIEKLAITLDNLQLNKLNDLEIFGKSSSKYLQIRSAHHLAHENEISSITKKNKRNMQPTITQDSINKLIQFIKMQKKVKEQKQAKMRQQDGDLGQLKDNEFDMERVRSRKHKKTLKQFMMSCTFRNENDSIDKRNEKQQNSISSELIFLPTKSQHQVSRKTENKIEPIKSAQKKKQQKNKKIVQPSKTNKTIKVKKQQTQISKDSLKLCSNLFQIKINKPIPKKAKEVKLKMLKQSTQHEKIMQSTIKQILQEENGSQQKHSPYQGYLNHNDILRTQRDLTKNQIVKYLIKKELSHTKIANNKYGSLDSKNKGQFENNISARKDEEKVYRNQTSYAKTRKQQQDISIKRAKHKKNGFSLENIRFDRISLTQGMKPINRKKQRSAYYEKFGRNSLNKTYDCTLEGKGKSQKTSAHASLVQQTEKSFNPQQFWLMCSKFKLTQKQNIGNENNSSQVEAHPPLQYFPKSIIHRQKYISKQNLKRVPFSSANLATKAVTLTLNNIINDQ